MSSTRERRQEARLALARRLSALAGTSKVDALLEEEGGRALVKGLPAEDVYAAIVDVGLADCTDIVQLSTPAQFRTYLDLAAWKGDRMDPLEVLRWVRAARGDDGEGLSAKLAALDIEVLELLFKKLTVAHDLEEDPDVNPGGVTVETPEGKFLLELLIDGPDEAALRQLTQDLIAQNPFELARFLEAVRWELPTELEEAAFQFRQARLQDLGFPPLEEAVKLFAWVDPLKVGPLPPTTAALVVTGPHQDFVEAAFKGLDAHERSVLQAEVRTLVNSALVAEGAEPGDPRAIRRLSEQARDTLNLGLEHLCAGDASQAAEVVRAATLKHAFQVGFSLTLLLRRQVERMAKEPGAKFGDTWLALDEETHALKTLLRKRPLKAVKVAGAEPVPFRSRREIAESFGLLERVGRQRKVLELLLGDAPAQVVAGFGSTLATLTPQRLFLAALVQAELGHGLRAVPVDASEVPRALAALFDGAALRPVAGQALVGLLPPEVRDEGRAMAERVTAVLLAELGPRLSREPAIDPKTLIALPVAGQREV